jgi:hypothetical protein
MKTPLNTARKEDTVTQSEATQQGREQALHQFLGEVWVNERGLAVAASANPSSFVVAGARNHLYQAWSDSRRVPVLPVW